MVLAAGHSAVQKLRRVDRPRQFRPSDRDAVEVLVVERPEVRELKQGRHGREARVGGAELEALDLLRLGVERRPGQLLGDRERRAAGPGLELFVPPPPARLEGEDDVRVRANGESAAPGPARSITDSCSWRGRSSAGKSRQERTTPSRRLARPSPALPSVGNAGRPSGRTRGSTASSTWVIRTGSPPRTTSTRTPSSPGSPLAARPGTRSAPSPSGSPPEAQPSRDVGRRGGAQLPTTGSRGWVSR